MKIAISIIKFFEQFLCPDYFVDTLYISTDTS
jgi:hypothetical protein